MGVILIIIMLLILICPTVYNAMSHKTYNEDYIRENAKIIDIKTEVVGLRGSEKYRTTVLFDDGFQYISHKTERDEHLLSYTISLSETTKLEIIELAVNAHEKAIEKKKRAGVIITASGEKIHACKHCGKRIPIKKNLCKKCTINKILLMLITFLITYIFWGIIALCNQINYITSIIMFVVLLIISFGISHWYYNTSISINNGSKQNNSENNDVESGK